MSPTAPAIETTCGSKALSWRATAKTSDFGAEPGRAENAGMPKVGKAASSIQTPR